MKFGIKVKIIGLILIPLVALLFYGGIYLNNKWGVVQQSNSVVENGKLIKCLSELIHQVQIERAKNALFFGGKLDAAGLADHRSVVDAKMTNVMTQFRNVHISDKAAGMIEEFRSGLAALRSSVSERSTTPEDATKNITKLIGGLIDFDVLVSSSESFSGVGMSFMSLSMLEIGKEYGGRFRANVLNVLGSDKPLSAMQVSRIEGLRAGVMINFTSPAVMISEGSKEKLLNVQKSTDWQTVQNIYDSVVNKASEGNFGQDGKVFYEAITSALNGIAQIIGGELDHLQVRIQELHDEAMRMFVITIIALAVTVIMIGWLAYYMIKSLTTALNQAVNNLGDSSSAITAGSNQLHQASSQMATSAVESASALEEVVASIEELNSIVAQNADRAKKAAELSSSGKVTIEQGRGEIEKLMSAMTEISDSSKKINEIIGIIDDIAFQTNLLALNASVEAARAGDQGKGFAVVAEAVRSLAQRSASAAKDIGTLIQASSLQVSGGVTKAKSSGDAMGKIVATIGSISQLNEEISAATAEQAQGINQISKALNELDTSTQQNASLAEQVASSLENMNEQTSGLNNLVSVLTEVVDGQGQIRSEEDSARSRSA